MASELGQAYVQIIPSARGISGTISRELNSEASSAGTSAGSLLGTNMVGMIKRLIVTAGIGKVLKNSIMEGADLEQNLGGTEAVFGEFADTLQSKATTAYKNMGLSASDYMATANKMGSLFQGSGIEQQRSLQLTTEAMQRAADVASVMGIDTSWAMESIAGAAKGNFTMMDNLGVAMNATTLQAYALEKGVNFNWNTADNAQKAELAMQMFMERTTQYAGNFAREADDTMSGSIGSVKAAWQDLIGNMALGNDVEPLVNNLMMSIAAAASNLIPAIGSVVAAVPGAISQMITTMLPQMMQNGVQILTQIASGMQMGTTQLLTGTTSIINFIITTITQNLPALLTAGLNIIQGLMLGIVNALPNMVMSVSSIITTILSTIVTMLPQIIQAGLDIVLNLAQGILTAFPQLVAQIPILMQNIVTEITNIDWIGIGSSIVQFLKDGINMLFDALPTLMKSIMDVAVALVVGIDWIGLGSQIINTILAGIQILFSSIPDLIKLIGTNAWDLFRGIDWLGLGQTIIGFIMDGIQAVFSNIPDRLKGIGDSAVSYFKSINWNQLGRDVIGFIMDGLQAVFSDIPDRLKGIADDAVRKVTEVDWLQLGKDIIAGIVGGIGEAGSDLFNALKGLASDALESAKNALKIGSPSKLFRDEVGKMIGEGMIVGIEGTAKGVQNAVDELSSVALPDINTSSTITSAIGGGGVDNRTFSINVYPSEGMDERALAERINEILGRWAKQEEVVYA